jgi:hypothetical protein
VKDNFKIESMMVNVQEHLDVAQQRKGRVVLILLLVFFAVPLIVVMMMYQFNWKPSGQSLGDLVKPPRAMESPVGLLSEDAQAAPALLWKEKWSIVFIANECRAECLLKLRDMRQLHASLYKDIPRTQRILITKMLDVATIKKDFPDLIIVNQSQAAIDALIQQFQLEGENPALTNRLYLVDPLGFLMMSYQSDTPLVNVRKDLARLLRFSWTG